MNRQQLTKDEKNLKNISNFGFQQQVFHVVNAAGQAMHQLSKDFPHDFAGLAVTHGHHAALQPYAKKQVARFGVIASKQKGQLVAGLF